MSIVLNGTTGITAPDIDVTAQTTVAAFDAGITLGGSATTLDDYEEGTWTPTLPNGGTFTISQTARFVKIGSQVTVTFYVSSVSPTANNDWFRIGGLPYAIGNTYHAGSCSYAGAGNLHNLGLGGQALDTYLYFHYLDGTSASRLTNNNMIAQSSVVIGTMTYTTV